MSTIPTDPQATVNRITLYTGRLLDALDDAAAAGGLARIARRAGPAHAPRLSALLHDLAAEIDESLQDLDRPEAQQPPPRRSGPPLLRRQASRPTPIGPTAAPIYR